MEERKYTLLERINKAFITRKYYLNRRIAEFATIHSRRRCVSLSPDQADQLTEKQRAYINELCEDHGFTAQTYIPDNKSN
ncbi:MAG: hypothetical protein EOP49_17755 [Sphingobacteriales bacterium]|nr:MAG: hypothetical protein EOP49_17755 [Sphingobacteriales bacterium]